MNLETLQQEVKKKFLEKFSVANFTWNGDHRLGEKSAAKSRSDVLKFIKQHTAEVWEAAYKQGQMAVMTNDGAFETRIKREGYLEALDAMEIEFSQELRISSGFQAQVDTCRAEILAAIKSLRKQ